MEITYKPNKQDMTPVSALGSAEIHVWFVSFEAEKDYIPDYRQILSPDESSRAERYRFERDRNRFIISRGVLRELLSRYQGQSSREISFSYGAQGKPYLLDGSSRSELFFNVSHSEDQCLFALVRKREIGADVEFVRKDPGILRIVDQFFSRREISTLLASPKESQVQGFFEYWTRKEAYLKAKGGGLSLPLDRFSVSLGRKHQPRLFDTEDPMEAGRWTLYHLNTACPYVGALAVEGTRLPVCSFSLRTEPHWT